MTKPAVGPTKIASPPRLPDSTGRPIATSTDDDQHRDRAAFRAEHHTRKHDAERLRRDRHRDEADRDRRQQA